MIRRCAFLSVSLVFLLISLACTKRPSNPQLQVEVPAGFTGNFVLDMGVRGASSLDKDGDAYVVTVPQTGKVETSTFLEKPVVTFKNGSDGRIWGFSQSVMTTGDGISVGGRIEFFVGTRQQFEAEQNKKKSGRFSTIDSDSAEILLASSFIRN
jgi:hypothetical protein